MILRWERVCRAERSLHVAVINVLQLLEKASVVHFPSLSKSRLLQRGDSYI